MVLSKSGKGLLKRPPGALLTCDLALAIRSFCLAVLEAGMRRRMEREPFEQRHIVRVDAVAQLSVGSSTKAGNQHTGESAEPDVNHIVDWAAASERPSRVVTGQRPK